MGHKIHNEMLYGADRVFIIARLGLSPEKQLYCTYKVYVFKRYSHYKYFELTVMEGFYSATEWHLK